MLTQLLQHILATSLYKIRQ